ncbi:TIGR02186 family protein [Aliiroseovarius sp. M344]|uniref:TIGR02186 family protein n=1 Tax=Aliiroseovarius sp. M344 TaxID=2867010 RepID=UPI0021ADCB70|nr:TIGR02186 family protein [Aliiroseovarius sp. M344]UWQ15269.1 TIGR02186 family protein [Aliiroseovarius sp. M344]
MLRLLAILSLILATALPARAEKVVAGLSQNRVSITATFVGSEILIFGAVKRDTPPPTDNPLQVIVVVEGPATPITVRKKDKRFGIWVNTESLELAAAPSFYAVATSAPLTETVSILDDLQHLISVERSIRINDNPFNNDDPRDFTRALIRIREKSDLYKLMEGTVNLQEETLFDTRIALPANVTEGEYRTRIYLTRGGSVASQYETVINVQKVGLERWIYNLAHEQPLVYGILSLVIAIAAGWGASALFRIILRT